MPICPIPFAFPTVTAFQVGVDLVWCSSLLSSPQNRVQSRSKVSRLLASIHGLLRLDICGVPARPYIDGTFNRHVLVHHYLAVGVKKVLGHE